MQLSVHAYASGTKGCSPLNAENDAGSCGLKCSERGQRPNCLVLGAFAMVRNGDVDVANCGSVPLNTIINSSLNRSQVPLSTSSPQPSVFQTMSSGSSTGPERITKSSSRYCLSMNRFLTHVAHRTLLCALGFSLLSGPSSAWVANLAIPSGVGRWSINWRSISHTLVFFRIIRRTRPCFEESLRTLAAILLQRNTPGLSSPWKSEYSRQSSACRGGESPSHRGHEGNRSSFWLC